GQTAAEKNSDTSKVDLISGKQLATLNDHIRQLSELSNSELDYVRNELSKELNVDVNENMPASMFNKAVGVLKQWIQQFQPQPEENITWGQS
ncbi:single-stranded DNA-binding protein, partial [Enterococcus faecalis]